MPMLKAERHWAVTKPFPTLSHYGAQLSWVEDSDFRHAILAANINILRRRAPFAYLFSNEDVSQDQLNLIYCRAPIGATSPDDDYLRNLEVKTLRRGVWLPYPDYTEPTNTTVTALWDGDILPFIPTLDGDNYSLLCLPKRHTLDEIDQIVHDTNSSQSALEALLKDGGCHIHIIDFLAFSVTTFDTGYAEHFPIATP